jgi:hypothetical protein
MKCGRNVYKSVQMTDGPLDMTNNQYDYNLLYWYYFYSSLNNLIIIKAKVLWWP